jgi:DNA primase
MGLCPFPDHREKTPSFSVNEAKQIFYCFGCKKGGNALTFLQTYQGMTFPQSIEFLAERASIPLPEPDRKLTAQEEQVRSERPMFYRITKAAAALYHRELNQLPEDHYARKYLADRKLTPEVVEQFKIGYSPTDWSKLAEFLRGKSAPLPLAEKLQLVRKKSSEANYYDFFRDRLMFPIFSVSGEVVGFGGRNFTGEQPKYINSTDSPIFHKSAVLYGLHESAKHIRAEDAVIVVEGYMDFLALFQAGIRNVVAPLGTALTADHARVIKRYTKNVIMLFDGDSAGQEASERSLPRLLDEELFPKCVSLPERLDPDEFIQARGVAALQSYLKNPQDLFEVVMDRKLKGRDLSNPTEKVTAIDQMAPLFSTLKDLRLKELYTLRMADRLKVETTWLQRALNANRMKSAKDGGMQTPVPSRELQNTAKEFPSPSTPSTVPAEPAPKISLSKAPKEELWLLNLALSESQYLELILQEDIMASLVSTGVRQLLEKASELYRHHPEQFDTLSSLFVDEVLEPQFVTQHLDKKTFGFTLDEGKRLLADCVRRIWQRENKRRVKELAGLLGNRVDSTQLEQSDDLDRLRELKRILEDRRALIATSPSSGLESADGTSQADEAKRDEDDRNG